MLPVREYLELLRDFFASGGYVLWVIFLVALLLWTLIIERYAYLRLKYPRELAQLVATWRRRADQSSWFAHQIRLALISDLSLRLTRSLALIKSLIAICPLLGLLGTVIGIINAFAKIAAASQTGTDPSKLANDISFALFTAALGLTIAIPLVLAGAMISVRIGRRREA
mgnify:CR=1 FL=1